MGWFLNHLTKFGIQKQTHAQKSKIDAVMFVLWAQGHRERSWFRATEIILVSWVVDAAISLIFLPFNIIRRIPEILFVLTLTLLILYSIDNLSANPIGILLILVLIIFKSDIIQAASEVLFDIGDLLTLSALSRRYIARHLALGPLTYIDDENKMPLHLFASRILDQGPYLAEIEALQQMVAMKSDDLAEVEKEIDEYWRQFPPEQTFWRERLSRIQTLRT